MLLLYFWALLCDERIGEDLYSSVLSHEILCYLHKIVPFSQKLEQEGKMMGGGG